MATLSTAENSACSAGGPASSQVERFRLAGPSVAFDPRTRAVRKDLAERALAGEMFAPYYADPLPRRCVAPCAMMRAEPRDDAPAVSQLLRGEGFSLLDLSSGWAWGYSEHDHYVGYIRADALGEPEEPASHLVDVPSALLFSRADIKSAVVGDWPIGSRFAALGTDGDFIVVAEGFIHHRHVRPIGHAASDPPADALRLIGLPYLWGGRGGGGIDCSGLVQLVLALAGVASPRDSDQQRVLGAEIADGAPLRRGDLIFFPGHVGIMADADRLIHANAYWMQVTIEPLAAVTERLSGDHAAPILCRRRLQA